jgi:hypothetical protein
MRPENVSVNTIRTYSTACRLFAVSPVDGRVEPALDEVPLLVRQIHHRTHDGSLSARLVRLHGTDEGVRVQSIGHRVSVRWSEAGLPGYGALAPRNPVGEREGRGDESPR